MELIGGLGGETIPVPNGGASAVRTLPGLHHEVLLHPGDGQSVVKALLGQCREVLHGLRGLGGKKHCFEHACRGIEHRDGVPRRRVGKLQLCRLHSRAADRLHRTSLPALDAGEDIMCTASGQNCRQGQCRHYFFQGSHERASLSIYYSKDGFSKAIAIVYHIPAREARGKSVKICYWISMRKTS